MENLTPKKYVTHNGKKYIRFSYAMRDRDCCLDYIGRGKWKTLDEPIIYFIDYDNKNEYVIIPPNYVFDFNSSPCFAHCIVDRDQFMIAIVHDILYTREAFLNNYRIGMIYIDNIEKKSERFKSLAAYGGGYDKNYMMGIVVFTPARKAVDQIWKDGAILENTLVDGSISNYKIFLGYLGIRIGGRNLYKK